MVAEDFDFRRIKPQVNEERGQIDGDGGSHREGFIEAALRDVDEGEFYKKSK